MSTFGFRVTEVEPDPWEGGDRGGWKVHLPHQCDGWTITADSYYDPDPTHEEAVTHLRQFIAEATEALAALERKETFPS